MSDDRIVAAVRAISDKLADECGYDAEEGGPGRPRTINTRARRSLEPSADGPVLAEPSMCGVAAGRPSSKLRFRALPADYTPPALDAGAGNAREVGEDA